MKLNIIFIILLSILLVGCNTPSGNIVITSPIKTCKFVDTPYQEQESYYDTEPYQAVEDYQVGIKYQYSGLKDTFLNGFDVWAKGEVNVRNVDSETAYFTVKQTIKTLNGKSRTYESSKYVMPGETKTFTENFDIDVGEDFNIVYDISEPTKTLSRTVTKYKQVLKYKTVTKYKSEEVCN